MNGASPLIASPDTIGQPAPPGGPGGIGQIAAIAVGAWTDIGEILYPAWAAPGDLVNVRVTVKNLADYGIYIAVGGRYDNSELRFTPEYAVVDPGASYTFPSSFIMPNKDVQVSIWSFFLAGGEWYQDDYEFINIALTGAPPEDGVQIMSVNTYVVN